MVSEKRPAAKWKMCLKDSFKESFFQPEQGISTSGSPDMSLIV